MEQQQHTREISNSSIITQEQNRQEEELQGNRGILINT